MSDRELVAVVVIGGDVYGPGYENPPPAKVAARITNPSAWGDADPVNAEPASPPGGNTEEPPAEPPAAPPVPVEPAPETEPAQPATTPAPALPVPPRSGPGSGINAWRAYANACKVAYPADAGREQIIEACEKAGVV